MTSPRIEEIRQNVLTHFHQMIGAILVLKEKSLADGNKVLNALIDDVLADADRMDKVIRHSSDQEILISQFADFTTKLKKIDLYLDELEE